MKKHSVLFLLFIFAEFCCFTIAGCGGGSSNSYSESSSEDSQYTPQQILNRTVSDRSGINQTLDTISIDIPANAAGEDYSLVINQTRKRKDPISELSDFELLSSIYSIQASYTDNKNKFILENPAKLSFHAENNYPNENYYAAKFNDGNWHLMAPTSSTLSSLEFLTHNFSDWVLVKRNNKLSEEQTPVITSPDTVLTNGEGGNFKQNASLTCLNIFNNYTAVIN